MRLITFKMCSNNDKSILCLCFLWVQLHSIPLSKNSLHCHCYIVWDEMLLCYVFLCTASHYFLQVREQMVRTRRKLQLWILGGWLLEIWKTAAELKVKNMNLDFLFITYDKRAVLDKRTDLKCDSNKMSNWCETDILWLFDLLSVLYTDGVLTWSLSVDIYNSMLLYRAPQWLFF